MRVTVLAVLVSYCALLAHAWEHGNAQFDAPHSHAHRPGELHLHSHAQLDADHCHAHPDNCLPSDECCEHPQPYRSHDYHHVHNHPGLAARAGQKNDAALTDGHLTVAHYVPFDGYLRKPSSSPEARIAHSPTLPTYLRNLNLRI